MWTVVDRLDWRAHETTPGATCVVDALHVLGFGFFQPHRNFKRAAIQGERHDERVDLD